MPLELISISKDYFSLRPGMKQYLSMPSHDMMHALNDKPIELFKEITGLVLFLTPYCNFNPCDHCCVFFENFREEEGFPVMSENAAISLSDMVSPAKQFTASGGDVFLLDRTIREKAASQGYITNKLAYQLERYDYFPRLIAHLAERLRRDWEEITKLSPLNQDGRERFLRVPTNGFYFPELTPEETSNAEALRNSELYKMLKPYRGIILQMSIGPFQEIKYKRSGKSIQKKIDDLCEVVRVLSEEFSIGTPNDNLNDISLGFMFTYLYGEPEIFDMETALRHPSIEIPTQDFDKNETLIHAQEKGLVEMQRVIGVSNATRLNGASKEFSARPKRHISETDELYAVALKDNQLGIFTNTIHMYEGRPENAVALFKDYS